MEAFLIAAAVALGVVAFYAITETKIVKSIVRFLFGLVVALIGVWLIQRGVEEGSFSPVVPGLMALAVGFFGVWTGLGKGAG